MYTLIRCELWGDMELFQVASILPLRQNTPLPPGSPWRNAMPRTSAKADDLAAIKARRETLRAELAALDERAKAMEIAARDAGRQTLMAALERVKIAEIDKADARTIAVAIGNYGGSAVARHLATLPSD